MTSPSATPGRDALRETLSAIDAKEYQLAGETALRGVATPLRVAGESLAEMLESFARPGDDPVAWRDRVLDALDQAVPAVLDAVLVLYANVLFHRLVAPREKPLFDLDVPSNDDVLRMAREEIGARGAEGAAEHFANAATNESGKLVEAVVKIAELWSSCADDEKNLAGFYESAEGTAEEMLSAAKTLRLAAGVFRSC
jgi:hypothetical protein